MDLISLQLREAWRQTVVFVHDRISRHDILKGEQNQRNAQKHRDELKHTFNDVLTHTTPLSRD